MKSMLIRDNFKNSIIECVSRILYIMRNRNSYIQDNRSRESDHKPVLYGLWSFLFLSTLA